MPVYIHRQSETVLEIFRFLQDIRRTAAVPYPESSLFKPLRRLPVMETAFPAESLVKRPFPVYTGGILPVSVERSHYHVISGREFICNRLVGNQAGCTASDVARGYRERYGFGSGSGVLAGEIQAVLLQFPVIQKEQLDRTSREASGIYLRLVLRGAFGRIMDQGTEP